MNESVEFVLLASDVLVNPDATAIRSAQVRQLHHEYQILRSGMVGLRNQISHSSDYSEKLKVLEASAKGKTEKGMVLPTFVFFSCVADQRFPSSCKT